MSTARTRSTDDSDPLSRGVFAYLIFRVFNVVDDVARDAKKDWGQTLRAITIMVVMWTPLLIFGAFSFLIVTNETKSAWNFVSTNLVGYSTKAVEFGVQVLGLGCIALFARLASAYLRSRRPLRRSSAAETVPNDAAATQVESSSPIADRSVPTQKAHDRVGRKSRHKTDAHGGKDLDKIL